MPALNRRAFLCGAAALAAAPAFGAIPKSGEVDVVVIGAGAAGIAAGRRIAASGRRVAVVEAADRVGGRCFTDTHSFGVPFDRGAHSIHFPGSNPILKLPHNRFQVDPAPRGQRIRIGGLYARESELEDFLVAQVRSQRAIVEAARGRTDASCERALPDDLGDWRETVEFVFGPYRCGKDLAQVSVRDMAKAEPRGADAICRQGYGALLAALASDVPIALSNRVRRIDWRHGVEVETDKGQFSARAAIVTVSTSVLGSGRIAFQPGLPGSVVDAVAKLSLGSYDHIGLELPGNPLELLHDDLVFEKSNDTHTAALLANISGTDLCVLGVGGGFGRELAAQGEAAMTAFAVDWLAGLYGSGVKRAVKRHAASNWNKDTFIGGAVSVAAPGWQPARRTLMHALDERIWFAGEAVHETLWGTVGGAWDSGNRAAAAVLKALSRPPPKPVHRSEPRHKRRRHIERQPPRRRRINRDRFDPYINPFPFRN